MSLLSNFFPKKNDFFLGSNVKLTNTELGYKCNIAANADLLNTSVGKRTSIGRYTTIRNCTIGNYCAISWNCSLGAQNHSFEKTSSSAAFLQSRFGLVSKNITKQYPQTIIGNDVWIGCNAVILNGVTIGDGAVIGAGSIITKDIEPYSIVVGVPGKHKSYRFDEEIRSNLLASQWWDWEDSLLISHLDLFQTEMTTEISRTLKQLNPKL